MDPPIWVIKSKQMSENLARGAIFPPSDEHKNPDIVKNIPTKRWADENEAEEALLILLTYLRYLTGEIVHVDGGRHLV